MARIEKRWGFQCALQMTRPYRVTALSNGTDVEMALTLGCGQGLGMLDDSWEPDRDAIACRNLPSQLIERSKYTRRSCRPWRGYAHAIAEGLALCIQHHYLQAGATDVYGERSGAGDPRSPEGVGNFLYGYGGHKLIRVYLFPTTAATSMLCP